MKSKRRSSAVAMLGGLVSGAVASLVCTRRDMRAGEPTVIDKMKRFENRLYATGENKAATLQQIKQEAREKAAIK